jgi:hypothetical protein
MLVALAGVAFYLDHQNERELREAEAEADVLDPGWRFQDLLAKRVPVPDAENSAPRLLAAAAPIPAAWPNSPNRNLEDCVFQLSPEIRPTRNFSMP